MAGERSLNPTVEDCSDDEVVLESFRRSPAANVAAKRSHPSDLGSENPPVAEKVVNIDLQSDSGYSSYTAATMSSADSAPSAKSSQSPPAAAASAAQAPPPPSPAASKRRPTLNAGDRQSSSQNSPRKPLQRTSSVSSRRPPQTRRPSNLEECKDPNCTKCGPNALPSRNRRAEPLGPIDSDTNIAPPPFDQRSQYSDPAPSYTTPPSPMYSRQPVPYAQGPAVVQPHATRRRSSSTARHSYHGDPGPNYWVPGMPGMPPAGYPSPPQEPHGPPLSTSAHYTNMQHQPQVPSFHYGTTPPNGYYPPGNPMQQTSPPYYDQRPPLSARGSSFSARGGRPLSQYGAPLVTYDQGGQLMPSARYPQSAREPRFPQSSRFESSSSEYDSSEEEGEEVRPRARDDRALMPPPKLKSSRDRRPSLRHANTTQVDHRLSQSATLPERRKEPDARASRVSTATTSSRAPSRTRPALVQTKAYSTNDAPQRASSVLVNNSKSRRSQSYQYDQEYEAASAAALKEQKRQNRSSQLYRDDREDAIMVSESRRRRTDASIRRDEYAVGTKDRRTAMDAEAYQQRTRGTVDPLTERVHQAAKRASRLPSGPSDAGSSRSKNSDGKSRISQSARTTVTNGGGNGEIRLRVDASAPVSLSFNGDMEGRTLQINPAEGGMAELVIGNARGNESSYPSERGSVAGSRKSLVASSARRDAEESSVRSGSSKGRRGESERRVLRQRRHTEYN